MKKGRHKSHLDQEPLKRSPFGVPEGYFESFPQRLRERIRTEDQSPERQETTEHQSAPSMPHLEQLINERREPFSRPGLVRRRVLLAAAAFVLGMVTIPLIRMLNNGPVAPAPSADMAILEQLQVFEDDRYLYDVMNSGAEPADPEKAYEDQVIEYLAISDVEEVLLFD